MNSEYVTMYQATASGLMLVASSFLYSRGGRSDKWYRRWIGSCLLALTVNIVCLLRGLWSPYLLIVWPCLSIGFHLGYGSEIMGIKILKRTVYALAVLTSGLVCMLTIDGNAWMILIPHIATGAWSIWLGVKNPIEASAEEFFVCMTLNLYLMAYPFVTHGS